jgi:replication factor C subunit 1
VSATPYTTTPIDPSSSGKSLDPLTQLWTVRYAPKTLKEICGNKGQIEKLQQWLGDWSGSLKSNFKKPGKNGTNVYRAMMITGPPGIGKTTSAHLCAQLAGFTPIEMNASDARSKKLIEVRVCFPDSCRPSLTPLTERCKHYEPIPG